jgi:aconitate hydratase
MGGRRRTYLDMSALGERFPAVSRLPVSLLILLENLLRHEDGKSVTAGLIEKVADRNRRWGETVEIAYHPSRIVMQDYSGLVALTDLATIRDRIAEWGGDAAAVRPVLPVTLVIDHSLTVDCAGTADALEQNAQSEYMLNSERYQFLKWAQTALDGVRIVPPGNGIIHQINLEQLALVVTEEPNGLVYPETQIGTDSHTTMINGLGVLGWGVGGIEAEAAMLGEPVSMLIPDVVGARLSGQLPAGVLATDLVLTVTQKLREVGVVERFVEFFGPGLAGLTVGDRATMANMAPEYGATCGMFPIDQKVIDYLSMTGRSSEQTRLVEDYARLAGLWNDAEVVRDYAEVVEIDLSTINRSVAGPKRPQQRLTLAQVGVSVAGPPPPRADEKAEETDGDLANGDVVIAAITSCTNTSNPHAMITAGLLARNAVAKGLSVDPRVKTTLAPGSKSVSGYLTNAGLSEALDLLGFQVVGYACTTCVGNSGPLAPEIEAQIRGRDLDVASVLSGNRNFEGRIHSLVKSNYLASPPLVIAYALAGTMRIDLDRDPIGVTDDGNGILLADIWPDAQEVESVVTRFVGREAYANGGSDIYSGGPRWDALDCPHDTRFDWDPDSTYISPSPFVEVGGVPRGPIQGARPLLLLGDNVTTDHISPTGAIERDGPAAALLEMRRVTVKDFNTYGARRGNAEVMARGTFVNVRLRNELASPRTGGYTRLSGSTEPVTIFDAAASLKKSGTPAVVVAGANYGTGSARDWAAKGTRMLGVRAVLADSFERIHRANLVLMGVVPIEFVAPASRAALNIDAESTISIDLPVDRIEPRMTVDIRIDHPDHEPQLLQGLVRVDTAQEAMYLANGGVLPTVLKRLANDNGP